MEADDWFFALEGFCVSETKIMQPGGGWKLSAITVQGPGRSRLQRRCLPKPTHIPCPVAASAKVAATHAGIGAIVRRRRRPRAGADPMWLTNRGISSAPSATEMSAGGGGQSCPSNRMTSSWYTRIRSECIR